MLEAVSRAVAAEQRLADLEAAVPRSIHTSTARTPSKIRCRAGAFWVFTRRCEIARHRQASLQTWSPLSEPANARLHRAGRPGGVAPVDPQGRFAMDEAPGTVKARRNTVSIRCRSGSAKRARPGAIGVRVTAEERMRLSSLAFAAGARSLADYLRRAGLAHALPVPGHRGGPADPAIAEALRRVSGALGAIGNNANQIARACNAAAKAGDVPSPDVGGLLDVAAALDRIHGDVRTALGIEAVGEDA